MKKVVLLLCVIFLSGQLLAQCSLSGLITDGDTAEAIPFANVVIMQDGIIEAGVMTGFEGEYCFVALNPGRYDVEISYVGYPDTKIEGVVVFDGQSKALNVGLQGNHICCCCWVYIPSPPLFEMDVFESGMTFELDKKGLIRQ